MTDDTTIVTVAQAIHAASLHAGMPLGHCDCAKAAAVAVEAARVGLAAEVLAAVEPTRETWARRGNNGYRNAHLDGLRHAARIVRGQS